MNRGMMRVDKTTPIAFTVLQEILRKNCDFLVKILLFLAKKQRIITKSRENQQNSVFLKIKNIFMLRTLFL
jgi:hypothetical protein